MWLLGCFAQAQRCYRETARSLAEAAVQRLKSCIPTGAERSEFWVQVPGLGLSRQHRLFLTKPEGLLLQSKAASGTEMAKLEQTCSPDAGGTEGATVERKPRDSWSAQPPGAKPH